MADETKITITFKTFKEEVAKHLEHSPTEDEAIKHYILTRWPWRNNSWARNMPRRGWGWSYGRKKNWINRIKNEMEQQFHSPNNIPDVDGYDRINKILDASGYAEKDVHPHFVHVIGEQCNGSNCQSKGNVYSPNCSFNLCGNCCESYDCDRHPKYHGCIFEHENKGECNGRVLDVANYCSASLDSVSTNRGCSAHHRDVEMCY